MRKITIGFALFIILVVAAYLRLDRRTPALEIDYAANREVILWNTTAVVRQPVTTVNFGERLDVLRRSDEQAEVRTSQGLTGWVSQGELISSELWDKAEERTKKAQAMPVEARGHTRVLSNLHVEPGRDEPRLRQLSRNVPVDLLERKVVAAPVKNESESEADDSAAGPQGKPEDWWFVLAHTASQSEGQPPTAGWMLGRFIDLDVPQPLPDYASSAGIRIVSWFELNRVKDASGNPRPQYLVLGEKGPEGRACDFTELRVYTWAVRHGRYETAFVDSNVCGKLPLEFTHESSNALTFSFQELTSAASERRTYRMIETIVRRLRQGTEAKARRAHS